MPHPLIVAGIAGTFVLGGGYLLTRRRSGSSGTKGSGGAGAGSGKGSASVPAPVPVQPAPQSSVSTRLIPVRPRGGTALIGDSIGVGTARYLPNVENFAVQGYTTHRMGQVADRVISPGAWRVVVVEGHLNDMRQPASTSIPRLRRIYQAVKDSGAQLVVVSGTPWKGYRQWTAQRGAWRQEVNAWILGGGGGLADQVVNAYRLFDDPARPGYLKRSTDGGDQLHLNRAGYRQLAQAIQSAVSSL